MSESASRPTASQEELDVVEKIYEQTLIIPNHKLSPPWILMPVGLIGSGKTTVVKPLAEHFGLIRLSTDEVRKLLKESGYSYEGCRDIIMDLLHKYLRLGYSLALDANTGSKDGVEYNARTKETFPEVRQLFIYINPPEEFIITKLKNYNHTWLFKDGVTAIEQYFMNKNSFELPNLPFVYTFDTSRKDLPEQLTQCIKNIEKALSSDL